MGIGSYSFWTLPRAYVCRTAYLSLVLCQENISCTKRSTSTPSQCCRVAHILINALWKSAYEANTRGELESWSLFLVAKSEETGTMNLLCLHLWHGQ